MNIKQNESTDVCLFCLGQEVWYGNTIHSYHQDYARQPKGWTLKSRTVCSPPILVLPISFIYLRICRTETLLVPESVSFLLKTELVCKTEV